MSLLARSLLFLAAAFGLYGQVGTVETAMGWDPNNIPATSFSINYINSLVASPQGDIYFVEAGSPRVFHIAPDGVLSIFAGNGLSGPTAFGVPALSSATNGSLTLALDPSSGDLLIRDETCVYRVDRSTGITSLLFNFPYESNGVAIASISQFVVDAEGDLYIADNAGQTVEKYDPATGAVTVLAGNGKTGVATPGVKALDSPFSYPSAIALGADGAIFFADLEAFVFRIDPKTGVLSAVDLSGGTASEYDIPYDLAVDAAGDVFAAIPNESMVAEISAGASAPIVFAGTGSQHYSGDGAFDSSTSFPLPETLALDPSGNLLVGSATLPRLLRIDVSAGQVVTIAGNGLVSYEGDGNPASSVQLYEPAQVLPQRDGGFLVSSSFAGRILRVLPDGGVVSVAGGGDPTSPFGVTLPASQASLFLPQGMWGSADDAIYFSDYDNSYLSRWSAAADAVDPVSHSDKNFTSASSLLYHAAALIASGADFYLSDPDNNTVWRIPKATGAFTRFAGSGDPASNGDNGPAAAAAIAIPSGLAGDLEGNIYIAESGTDLGPSQGKIRRVQAGSGVITTVLDGLAEPNGLAFNPDGRLCYSETWAHRIGCLDLKTGATSVIAGSGVVGFSGDGGSALAAQFYRPLGIAFDSAGDLYVADTGNQRVRVIHFAATVAAPGLRRSFDPGEARR